MVSAMRALPPAFFWWLSITGEAMLRSCRVGEACGWLPSTGRTGSRIRSRSAGGHRGSARSRGPRARPTRNACRPCCRHARRRRRTRAGRRGWTATSWPSGLRRLQRGFDGAVQPVVGDEVAVAVLARLSNQVSAPMSSLSPHQSARQAWWPRRRDLIAHLGVDFGEEIRRRGVEIAGEHEVLPDHQARARRRGRRSSPARSARRPRRGSCSCCASTADCSSARVFSGVIAAGAARRRESSWSRGRRSGGR